VLAPACCKMFIKCAAQLQVDTIASGVSKHKLLATDARLELQRGRAFSEKMYDIFHGTKPSLYNSFVPRPEILRPSSPCATESLGGLRVGTMQWE
jgi:hypothetical protein